MALDSPIHSPIHDPRNQERLPWSFLLQILESLPFYLFVKDRAFRYTYVNQKAAKLYGMPIDEILGKEDKASIANPIESSGYRLADSEVLADKTEKWIWGETYTTRSGVEEHLTTAKAPLLDANDEAVGVVALAADMEVYWDGELFRSVSFLSSQSYHTLRGRLAILKGDLSLIKDTVLKERIKGSSAIPEAFSRIEKALSDINDLSEMMGRMAKIRTLYLTDDCDFEKVAEVVSLKYRSPRFSFVLSDLLEPKIRGNFAQLLSAVDELIHNADRHAGEHGRVEVRLFDDRKARMIVLEVSNTGEGFDSNIRADVFRPGVSSSKDRTGLGLFHVKSVCEMHGGAVSIVTKRGFSATVRMELPSKYEDKED